MRRALAVLLIATALTVGMSACMFLPQNSQESGSGMTDSIDKDALGEAVTATSPNIDFTFISVELDGLTHVLYVRPAITTSAITATELDAILRVAYTQTVGSVQTIEIRTVDSSNEPLDVKDAAIELGIHYLPHVNSVSYSTEFLKKAYDE